MAGELVVINGTKCLIDYADGVGEAIVDGKKWSWEFHEYCGPMFLTKKGQPRKCQCPTNKKVWDAFQSWHDEYRKNK